MRISLGHVEPHVPVGGSGAQPLAMTHGEEENQKEQHVRCINALTTLVPEQTMLLLLASEKSKLRGIYQQTQGGLTKIPPAGVDGENIHVLKSA